MLCSTKGVKKVGRNESKTHLVSGKIDMSFFVGSAMIAEYTPEGQGLAGEG